MPAKSFKIGESILPGLTYLDRLPCKPGMLGQIAWSPDGLWLAVPTYDSNILLWEMETRVWQTTDFRQTSQLCSMAWSPDSRCLVAGFVSGRVMLWDMPGCEWVEYVDCGSLPARLIWSQDMLTCAVVADARPSDVQVLHAPQRSARSDQPPQHHSAFFQTLEDRSAAPSLSISADGALLVSSSNDGKHSIWSLEDGRRITLLDRDPHMLYIGCADFNPSQNRLATSGRSAKEIDLWEYDTEMLLHRASMDRSLGSALMMVSVQHGERPAPRCFISRAPAQEKWAAKLARDLRAAGVDVLKDTARLRAEDWFLVAGAPEYIDAYPDDDALSARTDPDNLPPSLCIPLLVKGDWSAALPVSFKQPNPIPYDFSNKRTYTPVLYDLVLALYGIPLDHPGFAIWRAELRRLSGVPRK